MENKYTEHIVKKYGFKFTKSLGQNFLKDETVLKDIVEAAEISKEDSIIEIGPGVGTLTRELAIRAKKVYAVEIDTKLMSILQEEMKEFNNVNLINTDALKYDFNEIFINNSSTKIVANLPYYITTPILSKLLSKNYNFKSLIIMIQKEVAERIAAKPASKDYGALSLMVQYWCDVNIIRTVSSGCFIPIPKVESMVIRLIKHKEPKIIVKDEKLFFKIIRESFNMRRKTLKNALKNLGLSSLEMEDVFEEAGINPIRRGETLSIEEFGKLSDIIYSKIKK